MTNLWRLAGIFRVAVALRLISGMPDLQNTAEAVPYFQP
jgi:hypothetical protein